MSGRPREIAFASDSARLLLAASRERFSVAAADLLLPERSRLTEWQRHTAAALLARLIRSIEDMLRADLAAQFDGYEPLQATLSSADVAIALPLLERAQVLRDADLGTVLVRRVEEHRYWREYGANSARDLLARLIQDEDEAIASEAMTMLIARSRRFDRYQEPLLGHTDLPADLQHRLVWMVAAALRQYIVQYHDKVPVGVVDAVIGPTAGRMIACYDEGATMEASATRLARQLRRAERLEGADLSVMLEEGLLPLFVAGLAVRCAIDAMSAWEILSDPQGKGPAFLLRGASLSRSDAAAILLSLNSRGRLFSGPEGDAAVAQVELFDGIDESAAAAVLRIWQADPGYRAAIARLSTRRPIPDAA